MLLADLRSGEFVQNFGCLRRGDLCYCPAGLLCRRHGIETGVPWQFHRDEQGGYYSYRGLSIVMPEIVYQWAGIPHAHFLVGRHRLSELNDSKRLSFSAIADAIERHVKVIEDLAHVDSA
jgi:hypothetical protein